MPENRKIYIIGFMGSGKTTAGRKLASTLGWTFLDLDRKIEEYSAMKIPDIFSQHGEEYFRKVESQVLKEMNPLADTVISTGGGTPCYDNNMDLMISSGLTIYLKLTPVQLKSRLLYSRTERPLLKGLTGEDLLSFIEERLAAREKYYCRAELQINGFDINYPELNRLIKDRFSI